MICGNNQRLNQWCYPTNYNTFNNRSSYLRAYMSLQYLAVQYHSTDIISATDTQRLESAYFVFDDTLYKIPFAGVLSFQSACADGDPSTHPTSVPLPHGYCSLLLSPIAQESAVIMSQHNERQFNTVLKGKVIRYRLVYVMGGKLYRWRGAADAQESYAEIFDTLMSYY